MEDHKAVCLDVLRGKPIRKIRDKNGKYMTDAHLVSVLSKGIDWILHLSKGSVYCIPGYNNRVAKLFRRMASNEAVV